MLYVSPLHCPARLGRFNITCKNADYSLWRNKYEFSEIRADGVPPPFVSSNLKFQGINSGVTSTFQLSVREGYRIAAAAGGPRRPS